MNNHSFPNVSGSDYGTTMDLLVYKLIQPSSLT